MLMVKGHARSGEDAEMEAAFSAHDKRRVLTLLMARHGEDIHRYAIAMMRDRNLAACLARLSPAARDAMSCATSKSCPTTKLPRSPAASRARCSGAWHGRYRCCASPDSARDQRLCDFAATRRATCLLIAMSSQPAVCTLVVVPAPHESRQQQRIER
jgi:hypothetical protein